MRPLHVCRVEARSYELDSFGHLNHAVFLNYFEHARFQTLAAGGFPPDAITARDEGVHVVRVEVDYRREVRLGDALEIATSLAAIRTSSLTLRQVAYRAGDPEHVHAEALVVAVWIGPDGRPMRIPADARRALEDHA
ncbi:MAG: acyl-CoA thioesterase [Longimicrobiales bacterium]|nr:acyl-CoA thioesterase [Longimicrobiales bacterium]